MKTLFIADPDETALQTMARQLESREDISILTASTGKAAVEALNGKPVDLIITDVRISIAEDTSFLDHLEAWYSQTPIFVTAPPETPEELLKTRDLDSCRIFRKPLDLDQLTESIIDAVDDEVEGAIHSISLPSFLQLVEMENKTCTLTVTPDKGGQSGKLYFVEGELFGARLGGLEDEAAAYRILGWEKASILIHKTCKAGAQRISQPLMKILMEGQRIKDEESGETDSPAKKEAAESPEGKNDKTALSPDARALIEHLDSETSILAYALYDDAGRPIDTGRTAAPPFGASAPSKYFPFIAGSENAGAQAKNQYLLFSSETGAQVLVFQYKHLSAVASLKPGHPPYALIQRIRSQLPNSSQQPAQQPEQTTDAS